MNGAEIEYVSSIWIVSYLMTTIVVNPKIRVRNIEAKVNAIGQFQKWGIGGV